jgi:hypothetical protein
MEPISPTQKAVADRIVEHGKKLGVQQHLIDAAVKFAYFESRLGKNVVNRNALGIFQYMPTRWKERHQKDLGDRSLPDNQIAAMYRDLRAYERRYNDLSTPEIPRGTVTLEEYLYIKHHDGPNGRAFVPGLRPDGKPNGLKVYRDRSPTYDATAIFGSQKTSTAPIRNPWEITFGLPGRRSINWFQPASLKLNNDGSEGNVPAAARGVPYGPSVTPYGPPRPFVGPVWPTQSLPWPGVDNPWRTPEPHWASERRSYLDTHHYDPNGASVSTRHRSRRSVGEMTEAMESAAPPVALGAGASDPATSISRHAPLLTVQA